MSILSYIAIVLGVVALFYLAKGLVALDDAKANKVGESVRNFWGGKHHFAKDDD